MLLSSKGIHPEVEVREINGFPGYYIGIDGSVWTRWIREYVGAKLYLSKVEWRQIKATCAGGYYFVMLRINGGKEIKRAVHRLLLEAFVSPCPPGMQCRHLDDNGTNNSLPNLKWGTAKENAEDRDRNGRTARGDRHTNAKLSNLEAKQIQFRRLMGEMVKDIAKDFPHVSEVTVANASRGRTYKYQLRN